MCGGAAGGHGVRQLDLELGGLRQPRERHHGLSAKYSACGQSPIAPFDVNHCNEAFSNINCTDAERQDINDYANCLLGLPNCTPATQSAWLASFQGCTDHLSAVSC
jgi:hypothetical protein